MHPYSSPRGSRGWFRTNGHSPFVTGYSRMVEMHVVAASAYSSAASNRRFPVPRISPHCLFQGKERLRTVTFPPRRPSSYLRFSSNQKPSNTTLGRELDERHRTTRSESSGPNISCECGGRTFPQRKSRACPLSIHHNPSTAFSDKDTPIGIISPDTWRL